MTDETAVRPLSDDELVALRLQVERLLAERDTLRRERTALDSVADAMRAIVASHVQIAQNGRNNVTICDECHCAWRRDTGGPVHDVRCAIGGGVRALAALNTAREMPS